MGMYSELEEAVDLWDKSSNIKRSIIIISVFFTISSLTSLSDTIFKWKGFILDGLNFYKTFISGSIIDFFDVFSIIIYQNTVDFMVLLILGVSALYRKDILKNK